MKHIGLATVIMVLLTVFFAGCGNMQQIPPVANGPQAWGKEEPYSTLRNATIKGSATGSWMSKKYEKMDRQELQKLSRAEGEALIAAGYDPWTGTLRQQAGATPYKVKQLVISDGLSQGKTYDSKGKEVALKCLVSNGNGFFREAVDGKKEKAESSSPSPTIAEIFGFHKNYTPPVPETVIITACARQDGTLSHVTVEKPKPAKANTEGGN